MREIKFRGKSITTNQWVYGCYIESGCDAPCIIFGDGEQSEIDKNTLGQFTGLKDANGVEIFEGDIVNNINFEVPVPVYWSDETPRWEIGNEYWSDILDPEPKLNQVIGNAHEHPHLLNTEGEV